ncbi:hypothetical protein MEN24_17175, partial [Dolichospermum sp. ST_sed10]|nr:hypothetical protein [Dolichospermum sp. ST_sed10]
MKYIKNIRYGLRIYPHFPATLTNAIPSEKGLAKSKVAKIINIAFSSFWVVTTRGLREGWEPGETHLIN